ncbi:MAG TPA: protein kinase [Gemmatimonadales bacterium]|nr:protein kinase [Gemmatimonadales bacterium]
MTLPLSDLSEALRDRYRLERELGRGGMATVYLAHDLKHDRPVALKVLHPDLAASLGAERFQREIRLAARLQHPHVLTVLDSGEARTAEGGASRLWFTMPYVEGESLRDRLNRERQLPVADALRIATEAARALDYAHQHGVVHRDVKPENILLTRDGSTLVADFGIARALGGAEGDGAGAGGLTGTGMSIGTPVYMSPEQASGGRDVDARTDVYSLATVLYEMLAGEPPFAGPTPQAAIARRFTETPRPLRSVRETVSPGLDAAVAMGLARVPADRFATAGEFAHALNQSAELPTARMATPGAGIAPPAAQDKTPAPSARRRVPIALVTLGLGFVIGLGVLFAWRRSHAGGDAEPGGVRRLAVLPFENLGESSDAYFADGVTDAVRGKLAGISGLRVTASASASQYRHSTKPLGTIARELGVDYVLVGKIRWQKTGGTSRVEVSPELVDLTNPASPATRWQQPFDAALTDVFKVQGDIAGRVAQALDVALGASQEQALAERPTANVAAYDAFLKGEEASLGMGAIDPAALRRAAIYYGQAVALDSTFGVAWAQLSRAYSNIFALTAPTPADAEQARAAAERARALAPGRAETQSALGDYAAAVQRDLTAARAAYQAGLERAPSNADLLAATALAEQSLGRFDAALEHLQRAAALDPRSFRTARRLAITYLWLKRYPEGLAAVDRAVAIAPTSVAIIHVKAIAHLMQGDLAGARAVIHAAQVEPTTLAAYFATFWDLFWPLDDAQQALITRLPPSVFDNDRGNWGLALAGVYHVRGDETRTRAYADSARAAMEEHVSVAPNDAQQHVLLGVALAYMGRKADAIREGERGVAITPLSKDAWSGAYYEHQLVRIYILVGEREKAIDHLAGLVKAPYFLSPGWLRIDPAFDPLRGNPRFEALAAGR